MPGDPGRIAQSRALGLLPAGFGVISRGEAHRFDFVNLAPADLENVRGRHIERVDIQWHLIDARYANDRYELLLHGMAELGQSEHQASLGIGDPDTARFDALDVVKRVCTQLSRAPH